MNLLPLRLAALALTSSRISLVRSFAFPALYRYSVASLPSLVLQPAARLRVRCFSSSEVTEGDLLRWEKMYQAGSGPNKEEIVESRGLKCQVRVVSFDLDNTLWRTSSTIDAANDALAAFLESRNISQPERVEKLMGDLFRENKQRYCPVEPETAKAPVCLTLLRKDAIQKVLEDHNAFSRQKAVEFAEAAFDEWTRARHEAIPSHFASSVEECLQEISSLRTSNGHPVLIGAITDGNSDPQKIEVLSDYFDFCVNAETVGVGKPDKRVFLEAVAQVASHPTLSDLFSSSEENSLEDSLGPFWVHIGDDFLKDIVAAKSLNMRSIWARELVMDKVNKPKGSDEKPKEERRRTVEELVKEVSEMKVITMQLGAEDYLANGLQQEFVDATADKFSDLSGILRGWHGEGLDLLEPLLPVSRDTVTHFDLLDNEQSIATGDVNSAVPKESPQESKKFCIHCGANLPEAAKFCFSCGEKQP